MNIMFHSGNGFSPSADSDGVCGPDPFWRDILNEHQTRPFHVMIGGGDQIFNDSVITESHFFQEWIKIKNAAERYGTPLRLSSVLKLNSSISSATLRGFRRVCFLWPALRSLWLIFGMIMRSLKGLGLIMMISCRVLLFLGLGRLLLSIICFSSITVSLTRRRWMSLVGFLVRILVPILSRGAGICSCLLVGVLRSGS